MNIFKSLLTTFELTSINETANAEGKIGTSLKSNRKLKLSLSKFLIHSVTSHIRCLRNEKTKKNRREKIRLKNKANVWKCTRNVSSL